MSAEYFAYFGFGSLVNRATHRTDIVDAFPAKVTGWRRHWQERSDIFASTKQKKAARELALLSVHANPNSTIDGLLVIDKVQNIAALDEREDSYDRVKVPLENLKVETTLPADTDVFIYVAQQQSRDGGGTNGTPILQSYLDAVLQGYLTEWGEQGVHDFIATTDNFHTPILMDRHEPQYPRSVTLAAHEHNLFNELMGHHSWNTVSSID